MGAGSKNCELAWQDLLREQRTSPLKVSRNILCENGLVRILLNPRFSVKTGTNQNKGVLKFSVYKTLCLCGQFVKQMEVFYQDVARLVGKEYFASLPDHIQHALAVHFCQLSEYMMLLVQLESNKREEDLEKILLLAICKKRLTKIHYWKDLGQFNELLDSPLKVLSLEKLLSVDRLGHRMFQNKPLIRRLLRFCELFVLPALVPTSSFNTVGSFQLEKMKESITCRAVRCDGIKWITDLSDMFYKCVKCMYEEVSDNLSELQEEFIDG